MRAPAAAQVRAIAIRGATPEPPAISWTGPSSPGCHTNQPPIGPRTSTRSPTDRSSTR